MLDPLIVMQIVIRALSKLNGFGLWSYLMRDMMTLKLGDMYFLSVLY